MFRDDVKCCLQVWGQKEQNDLPGLEALQEPGTPIFSDGLLSADPSAAYTEVLLQRLKSPVAEGLGGHRRIKSGL